MPPAPRPVPPRPRGPAALALAGAVALGACGLGACGAERGAGPAAGPAGGAAFDAARVSAAGGAARQVFAIPVLAAVLAQGPRFVQVSGPATPEILPNVTPTPGATYVRNAAGLYVRDPARTGAPADGVRYVVRALDPATRAPAGPELGWADVSTESAAGERRVTVSDGRATVYASTFTAPLTSLAATTRTELAGTAGTGDGVITFRATTTVETGTPAGARFTPAFTPEFGADAGAVALAGLGLTRITTVTTASTAGASFEARSAAPLRSDDVVRTSVVVGARTLTLEQPATPYRGPFTPPAGAPTFYVPGDTIRVALDGAPFGFLVRPALGARLPLTFTRTDGSPVTAAERDAIAALLQAGGSLPSVSVIGLLVELWRLQIASGA